MASASLPPQQEKHLQCPRSIWGIPWPGREGEAPRRGQQVGECTGLGDVLGKGDSTTVGVRGLSPWRGAEGRMGCRSLALVRMVSAELRAGRELCQAPQPHGNPSTAGPSGEAVLHQPELRGARGTKQGGTALGEPSVPAAQEGSAAGGQLRGLRLELVSSHLSTMEQPS